MSQSHWVYGYHALHAALSVRPDDIDVLYLQIRRDDDRLTQLQTLAKEAGVAVSRLSANHLSQLVGDDVVHQGMVACCHRAWEWHESDLPALLVSQASPLVLILDSLQDPHNLGACMRSANAFDACAVIAPKNRAVSLTPTAKKIACGAADLTPFISVTNLARTLSDLQQAGLWLVGTDDQADETIDRIDLTGPIGIVMGNEGQGMRRLVRERCDFLARIDLPGDVSSLNVSVATGIALYEARRQRVS